MWATHNLQSAAKNSCSGLTSQHINHGGTRRPSGHAFPEHVRLCSWYYARQLCNASCYTNWHDGDLNGMLMIVYINNRRGRPWACGRRHVHQPSWRWQSRSHYPGLYRCLYRCLYSALCVMCMASPTTKHTGLRKHLWAGRARHQDGHAAR